MKIAPTLLLVLSAAITQAASFEARNRYDLEGTWNVDKQMIISMWTDPLGHGANYGSFEGEQIVEELMIHFNITFPEAPEGAKNVYSFTMVNGDGDAWHEFTQVVTPIVEDCGGTPCHYEPPTYIGSANILFSFFPEELVIGGRDLAGKTFDVSMLISPRTFTIYTHTAYNSKTVDTWGPSHYKTYVIASTTWDMETPEPGTFLVVGAGLFIIFRHRFFPRSS